MFFSFLCLAFILPDCGYLGFLYCLAYKATPPPRVIGSLSVDIPSWKHDDGKPSYRQTVIHYVCTHALTASLGLPKRTNVSMTEPFSHVMFRNAKLDKHFWLTGFMNVPKFT